MKAFSIVFGIVIVGLAVLAQVTGFGDGVDGAVYHHIWWALCGGFITSAGIFMK